MDIAKNHKNIVFCFVNTLYKAILNPITITLGQCRTKMQQAWGKNLVIWSLDIHFQGTLSLQILLYQYHQLPETHSRSIENKNVPIFPLRSISSFSGLPLTLIPFDPCLCLHTEAAEAALGEIGFFLTDCTLDSWCVQKWTK